MADDTPFRKKLVAFLRYLFTEPFIQIFGEIRDIWDALKNKKMWVLVWFLLFFILGYAKQYVWASICFVLFFFFLVIYLWERHITSGDYKFRERERIKKKAMKYETDR